jgi:hypothetical protein
MRQSLKVALSLLISVVVFSGFVLVAFSGLFSAIEASFYNPRVRREYEERARALHERVVEHHEARLARYAREVRPGYMARVFNETQLTQDIADREAALLELRREVPDLRFVRVVNVDGKEVHYSTLPSDLREQAANKRVYFSFDRVGGPQGGRLLLEPGAKAAVSMSGAESAIVY